MWTITFLGTSGSVPTRNRGMPAIALKTEREIILLDCGEGTQRQMIISKTSYMKVKRIFISHMHADHFFGLPTLIQTMSLFGREEKLEIYGPQKIEEEMDKLFSVGHPIIDFEVESFSVSDGEKISFGEYSMEFIEVDHSVPTLAVKIKGKDKPGRLKVEKLLDLGIKPGPIYARIKRGEDFYYNGMLIRSRDFLGPPKKGPTIVYSGDTRPMEEMIDFSRKAHLLIHEATFPDEEADKAYESYHTTPSQAIEIAKEAGVKALALTHISPRNKSLERREEDYKKEFPSLIIAKDLMKLWIAGEEISYEDISHTR